MVSRFNICETEIQYGDMIFMYRCYGFIMHDDIQYGSMALTYRTQRVL